MGRHAHTTVVRRIAVIIAVGAWMVSAASIALRGAETRAETTLSEREVWATLPPALLTEVIDGRVEQIYELVDDIHYLRQLQEK